MPTPYPELIQQLFNVSLFKGMKMGLDNMLSLCQQPQHSFHSVHVAGTNGKGSVVTKIAHALQLAGYRVGLYTSPHISCFRERIKINGEMITEEDVEELLPKIFDLADEKNIPATFFEIVTCLAFEYFAKKKVDISIIETGLGGRLDATNIVTPLLSIITSISLEHTEYLGHTIEEIAREKGGIIKPQIPVLIGPRVPANIINSIADEKISPCYQILDPFTNFEDENTSIAKKALELLSHKLTIPQDAIEKGVLVKPSCRLEIFEAQDLPQWSNKPFPEKLVMDVAHNPDGLKHLFARLKQKFPNHKYRVVFGLSKTKDIFGCAAVLTKYASAFHPVEAQNGRGVAIENLVQLLTEFNVPPDSIIKKSIIQETLQHAIHEAAEKKEVLIICGTFFIMSACREALGIIEPRDPMDINERIPVKR